MSKILKNSADVAEWLGTTPGTLAQWRYLGVGPRFIKLGRKVMYDVADVEAWLNAQTFSGNSEAAHA